MVQVVIMDSRKFIVKYEQFATDADNVTEATGEINNLISYVRRALRMPECHLIEIRKFNDNDPR